VSPRRLVFLAACLLPIATLLGGCSDDDDDQPTPAEACNAACSAQISGCIQTQAGVQACSTACQFGYAAVPACAPAYRAALDCVGGRPFLTCSDESITVSVATAQCTDELVAYLACLPTALPQCLDAPLGDAQCSAASMPPRARACLGEMPPGCRLFEGTSRAGGVGSFCCPR
jgi:hypothetical protein